MDNSKKKFKWKRKRRFRWMPNWLFIILAASMIGFSNAFYDEYRSIDNCRNFIQYEQLVNDEVKKRKKKHLKWIKINKTNT
jgi:hypothetical protein